MMNRDDSNGYESEEKDDEDSDDEIEDTEEIVENSDDKEVICEEVDRVNTDEIIVPPIVWIAKRCLDLISSVSIDDDDSFDDSGRDGTKHRSSSMFEELLKCLQGKRRSDFYCWDDVLSGRQDSVKILLDRGFSVHGTDRDGDTLLHYACKQGDETVVNELLDKGAKMVLNKKRETPIHISVTNRHINITKLLLERGAFVNSSDSFGYTPLHIAAKSNSEDMIEILLHYRADIRAKTDVGYEPIHLAVKNPQIVRIFLTRDIDVNVQSNDGSTPLHFSAKHNSSESIDILTKNKALVNLKDKEGSTPLLVQCKNFSFFSEDNMKCFECVKILLDRGSCTNTRDECGQTALHFATQNELVDIMEMLLEFGADPNLISESGDSPLHIAVRNQSLEVVYTLLEWGADVNLAGTMDETPLDIAAQSLLMFNAWNYSSEVLVKHAAKLIAAGVDIMVTDSLSALYKKVSPEFLKKCSDEVFKLSAKTIVSSISYLDILTSGEHRLTKYLRNPVVEEAYKRADYINLFPLYSSLLSLCFRIGFERNYLIERCFKLARNSTLSRLSFYSFETVCNYLSLSDLKTLSHACQMDPIRSTCYICKGMLTIPKHNVSLPAGSRRFHLIKILNY